MSDDSEREGYDGFNKRDVSLSSNIYEYCSGLSLTPHSLPTTGTGQLLSETLGRIDNKRLHMRCQIEICARLPSEWEYAATCEEIRTRRLEHAVESRGFAGPIETGDRVSISRKPPAFVTRDKNTPRRNSVFQTWYSLGDVVSFQQISLTSTRNVLTFVNTTAIA